MAQNETRMRPAGSAGPGGRPALEPLDPLPLSTALVQVALLLGVPITLLLLAKVVLVRFFPGVAH